MRFVSWGRSSPCIVNTHRRRRSALSSHGAGVLLAGGIGAGFVDRPGTGAVLHDASAQPRQPGFGGRRAQLGSVDHQVVVQVGDAAAAFTPSGLGEDADGERLEVVREVATDGVTAEGVAEQQARRLEGARGQHDGPGSAHLDDRRIWMRREVEEAHPGGPATTGIEHQLGHQRIGADLASPAPQCALQRGDRIALGMDGAAVADRRTRSRRTRGGRRRRRCSPR